MKKILLPVILTGSALLFTIVEVIIGLSVNHHLNFIEQLYLIFSLISFGLLFYSLRVSKHYLGSFFIILPMLFLKFLFWARAGAYSDAIDTTCNILNYVLMLFFFELLIMAIHGLWINMSIMKKLLMIFSAVTVVLILVLTVFSFINDFRFIDGTTDGGFVALKLFNNLVVLLTAVFPILLFLEVVKKSKAK